jgi:glycosyltransferase involved in cell wall biosynthesis
LTPARKEKVAVFSAGDVRVSGGLASMTHAVIDALETAGYAVDGYMPNWSDGRGWGVTQVEYRGRTWTCAQYVRSTNFGAALQVGFQFRNRLREYDHLWAVVGIGIWTLALAFARQPVAAVWVATPFDEEFSARFRGKTPLGRLALSAVKRAENIAERVALKRGSVRHVFALSKTTCSLLLRRHRLNSDRLSVLYPPVDRAVFHPNLDGHLSGRRCITVSRLDDERKNVVELISMWPEVVAQSPDAELVLVGPYDPAGRVAEAVAHSAVRDSIRMTGSLQREAVADELRRSSVFVLPSHQEGLGIVVMEALACGLPVVAYGNGGTDELLSANGSGRVVAAGDQTGFVREIISFLRDSTESPAARSEDFFHRFGTAEEFSSVLQAALVTAP